MPQFDHHTEDFAQHWRGTYAELRGSCPVAHSDRHGGFHVVTRYADVRRVLHDPVTFACGRELEFADAPGQRTGGVTVPVNPVRMGMMEMDPPESQVYRRLMAPYFSPKAIKDYQPRLAEIVSWLVDRVIGTGKIDFVDDLSNPLPALVSLDYFGLPLERWADYASALHKAAYREKGSARAVGEMLAELRAALAELRATLPERRAARASDTAPDTVVDRLLGAEVDGAPLPGEIVTEMVFMLLNGGIDTSTALIASMFGYLGARPARRAELAADPALVPTAVDEMLRYFTPGTGVARTVTAPVELGGVALRPGDRVLLALGSANNDPEMFPEPDDIRLDRDNNSKHLAFGSGIHRCLGAFLAPAEMTVLLREVLRRLPDYTVEESKVARYPTIPLVNGYLAMPASFTPGEPVLTGFDARLPVRTSPRVVAAAG